MTKKVKPPSSDTILKREQTAFKGKIRNTFTNAGFEYLPVSGKNLKVGNRTVEVDSVFLYENIILVCEDTCSKGPDRDHIRNKNEAFGEIKNNFPQFYKHLVELFPERSQSIGKYTPDRYRLYCLYFSLSDLELSDDDSYLYGNTIFVAPQALNYFQWIARGIRLSARYEIFRFLQLKSSQIGIYTSASQSSKMQAPIIYPKDITGLTNNVRVVSFMMSAEKLIRTCYVLRKDNWEDSLVLYQRLLDRNKLRNIRKFLTKTGQAFYNNIIVALPDDVTLVDHAGQHKAISDVDTFEEDWQLEIPDEINSICVIDGQHRIFAHYEGGPNDPTESKIASLRKQLHLLVTGLVFPPGMSAMERAKIQSEIFLEINSNAKPVPADVLLHIEMLKDPFSDIGLARKVIEQLNKKDVFANKFEMSPLSTSKIKIASIIKFALRYLVTITPREGRSSLFTHWHGDKEALLKMSDSEHDSYIDFCTRVLAQYFGAIREVFKDAWSDVDSRILSVVSLNGFIIALNRSLPILGVKDFTFYRDKFAQWTAYDFSKTSFPFTSSQYQKFSKVILKEVFDISSSDD